MHQHVVELVETLCTAGEDLLVAMGLDHKIRPEATNYRAVLDMYRSAARLGAGRRDWAAAAYWLLRMMRQPGSRVAESAYTDVLEICAAVSGRRPLRSPCHPFSCRALSLRLLVDSRRPPLSRCSLPSFSAAFPVALLFAGKTPSCWCKRPVGRKSERLSERDATPYPLSLQKGVLGERMVGRGQRPPGRSHRPTRARVVRTRPGKRTGPPALCSRARPRETGTRRMTRSWRSSWRWWRQCIRMGCR